MNLLTLAHKFEGATRSRATDVAYNGRLLARWHGQNPRVYLHPDPRGLHPVWRTYATNPAQRYAPYPLAQLNHWIDMLPRERHRARAAVYDVEHLFIFARDDNPHPNRDWFRLREDIGWVEEQLHKPSCRRVFTFSRGLMEHCQGFVSPDLHPKFSFVYPAFPTQKAQDKSARDAFTILVIASRWSDKGVPEALDTFAILRARHGERVRLDLVTQDVPTDFKIPDGVTLHRIPALSLAQKAQLYSEADVLFLPCLSETAACFPEAYAFGVPVVTTRIHHGDEFVREGETGFLLQAPLQMFGEEFGRKWRTADDFLKGVVDARANGELRPLVEQSVEVLDAMMSEKMDLCAMQKAARAFHLECFSPRARNAKLRAIYREALRG